MNISSLLTNIAKITPDKRAVVFPQFNKKLNRYDYSSITFKELDILSSKFAIQLLKAGLKKGDKTLLFLRPSLNFHAMAFALFKVGLVPVFIDPGMGLSNLKKCIKDCKPKGLIAEKEIHFLKLLYPITFKSIKINVTTASWAIGKTLTIKKMQREKVQIYNPLEFEPNDTAAILFTSGGTGTPKGVVYTHKMFLMQTSMLEEQFNLQSSDIDLPGFPLFSLFTIAIGLTSCIPDMDPTKPGQCDPQKIVQNIIDLKPTFIAGSPAIWERVADYCIDQHIVLPSVKYVVMFGAPVSVMIHKKFKSILKNGTTYTPYGATEALPISYISGDYILKNTAHMTDEGFGTCIGFPFKGIEIKIIKITNDIILEFKPEIEVKPLEIGEIIVKGPIVSSEYLDLKDKTMEAKIYDKNNSFWHRMGDLGFIDEKGLLWFCGRKAHLVSTPEGLLYPICCEAIFNKHPAVKRSALVGLGEFGKQIPAIVIERKDRQYLSGKSRSIFENELLTLSILYPHTKNIKKFYLSQTFPVDVRHNIKIDRLKLKTEIEQYEKN